MIRHFAFALPPSPSLSLYPLFLFPWQCTLSNNCYQTGCLPQAFVCACETQIVVFILHEFICFFIYTPRGRVWLSLLLRYTNLPLFFLSQTLALSFCFDFSLWNLGLFFKRQNFCYQLIHGTNFQNKEKKSKKSNEDYINISPSY